MSHKTVSVRALSKKYRINRFAKRPDTLRDRLSRKPAGGKNTGAVSRARGEDIWAIQDVSFEIEQGDVLGVIGRNGAGKSTLLKILARITDPTSGEAEIRGRIGSLLEVGTGFHPELTGRENVFLSSAILGMRRAEIVRKLDEIVSFAEVEQFLDTQVKHYSSGMYLKLAFSVAAHLEPEVRLIDEVLAVGDIMFQRKCLGKIGEVSKAGRTVLFVSHNMSAITELCGRGLFLNKGRATLFDRAAVAVQHYMAENQTEAAAGPVDDGRILLGPLQLPCKEGMAVPAGEAMELRLSLKANNVRNPWIFLIVEDSAGRTVIHSRVSTREIGTATLDGPMGLVVSIPPLWLSPGLYNLYFKFLLPGSTGGDSRIQSERTILHVSGDVDPTGKSLLTPKLDWSLQSTENPVEERAVAAGSHAW